MTMDCDREFSLLLESPLAYRPSEEDVARGGGRAGPGGRDARVAEVSGAPGLLRRAARRARRAGARAARLAAQTHPIALTAKYAGRAVAAATGPVRRRIFRAFFGKLIARRARLLSWRARRSLRPNEAERREARTWAVRYVRSRGILGKIVGGVLSGDVVGEAVTTTLVTASIPVIVEIARRALRAAESHGAPADPRAGDPEE